ncbi:MAG: fatty acid desaturase family protein [Alphaproteobacteria bacterium]|nr:fatty acid desaturase family protein [Alphaproteobacteria bacterium]
MVNWGMDGVAKLGEEFRDDGRGRRALPAAVIKELSRQNDAKAWASVISLLAVIAACVTAAVVWWTPWVVVPAILIIASRQQACFVLAHDAAHYRLFQSRGLNDLVGRALAAPVGISMRTYRVVHRLHHNHLYQPQDPDIPLHGGYPRGRRYLIRKLLSDLTGRTAPKTFAYFLGAPAINDEAPGANQPLHDTTPALRQAARRDRRLVIAFHIGAPFLAVLSGYGLAYLVLWILPLCTALQALLRLRAICEHGAVRDEQSPLLAARTNLGPAWLLWFLFPYRVNYHIEHHLYPAIPHYNLPACHRELQQRGLLDNAEVRHIFTTVGMVSADPVPAG